ncbi:glutamate--cysteine ligase [Actinoplanes sp. M2I2]|uniref:carboxylate-amine ligase n=1 Tax=Actinoplanes sp. M2I2 TaxID=1734444 RepID=UPI002020573A|nr:glutamate--cysteine ligase [Actinoplanes sp. M2I2]
MTSAILGAGTPIGAGPGALTIGVEEEFLLLDPDTGANRPVAGEVVAALPDGMRAQGRLEVRRSMVEMVTGVCTELPDLRSQLVSLRRAAAGAADDLGVRLVALGATPVGESDPSVPDQPRYRAIADRFGPVAGDPAVCGLHVHVGIPDRELAVQVSNHLQVWLPVIRALTGNSPLFNGADTGHASWRSVQLLRWPGVAPTPWFDSAADYDRTVADLVVSGVLLDPAMVYWYARLSPTYPTVEIRVNDVCTDVDDTVLAAALVRAAVATALTDIAAGRPAARVRDCVLAGAHWRAARDGLTHTLIDLRLGQARPAWDLVNEFFATVSPALLHTGDLDLVVNGLARLRERGDGATRQRETYRRTGHLRAVLDDVAARTTQG